VELSLAELAGRIGARLDGDPAVRVRGVAALDRATPETVSFLANPRYRRLLGATRAAAVILADPEAWVGPGAVVEAGARVAAGAWIGPGCVVGEGARVGEGTRLVANVTLGAGVEVGRGCLLHPGVVVGSDGFGFARDGERWVKVIDRGVLDDTVIEDGVKLDNQIQVAHNVRIGAHTVIAGCTGIAGSARIGRGCMIGGGVGIAGHLEIADGTVVTAMSLVSHTIREPGVGAGAGEDEAARGEGG